MKYGRQFRKEMQDDNCSIIIIPLGKITKKERIEQTELMNYFVETMTVKEFKKLLNLGGKRNG